MTSEEYSSQMIQSIVISNDSIIVLERKKYIPKKCKTGVKEEK